MAKVITFTHLTLDGVMQAPARPDEDTRGGFAHGGWEAPYSDAVMGKLAGEGMSRGGSDMLLGRRTYEDFARVWPNGPADNQFVKALNASQKYVASRTLNEPLPWVNSTLLKGDANQAVARLKREAEKDLLILGSGVLIQSLMRDNLVDQFTLLIHPLVLGTGRRLFVDDGALAKLKLVDTKTTTTGVMIATYTPAER